MGKKKQKKRSSVIYSKTPLSPQHESADFTIPQTAEHKNFHDNSGTLMHVSWPVLYTKHSLMIASIFVAYLVYFCQLTTDDMNTQMVGWAIAKALVMLFGCLGMMVFPTGPYIRPHPVFWRALFTVGCIYMFALTVFAMMTATQMRQTLGFLDPKLGVFLPDKSYAEDCTLNWSNVSDKLDIFVIAHYLGWVAKAIIIRDRMLLWTLSILWEFVEIATAYVLPNFAECWWDQWIMDVGFCNALGIECGMLFLHYYESDVPHYDWVPFMQISSLGQKAFRMIRQFQPTHWTKPKWENSDLWIRYFYYNLLILSCTVIDMNLFCLKRWLWMPTDHPFILGRSFLFAALTLVSSRQIYFYLTHPKCDFVGSFTWISGIILFLECVIIYKVMDPLPETPYQTKQIGYTLFTMWVCISYVALRRWKEEGEK